MSNPQVTITLGRTGKKVVKRPRSASDVPRTDSQLLCGSKRSIRERFDNEADTPLLPTDKRLRAHLVTRSPGYSIIKDARLHHKDLRLKLMRKRTFRRIQHKVEESKKIELREKMLRTIQVPEVSERGFFRHIPPTKPSGEFLKLDSFRRYYSSETVERFVRKSPDRIPRASRIILRPMIVEEVQRTSSTRQIDFSRTGRLLGSDILDPSRRKGPAGITMTTTSDADKRGTELPLASTLIPKSSNLGEQSHTVSSLLHSLGLGKYVVQFQAEEVDMTALKQMKDSDLKELGIPMGPRKKILLAILPRPKKQ